MKLKLFRALGLMSGTSCDGIDAALIETDGFDLVRPLAFRSTPYDPDFRARLRQHLGNSRGAKDPAVAAFERELTERHASAVRDLLASCGQKADLIGFHGQTLYHNPKQHKTVQIGDGALLASMTGIDVVNDFRSDDVRAGGHGAPLVPLFHRALVASLPKPLAILNIGGVSNITWVKDDQDNGILAFDVGPGNALIDDWVLDHTGRPFDQDGLLAACGSFDPVAVDAALLHPFFRLAPPKSLDRDTFAAFIPANVSLEDGSATLTRITASAIAAALAFLPEKPLALYVSGGGRHNKTLMHWIAELSDLDVLSVDTLGWDGDGLEAQAFAWLAVRSFLQLPLTLPATTGVSKPMTGGKLHKK